MCSGYHLYPLDALCQLAVVSRHLAAMDRERFPARQYDTWGGRDHYHPSPPVKVTFTGTLWRVEQQQSVSHPPD